MSIQVVEGQTAPIDYQLKADGANYNLTGCSVSVVGFKRNESVATFAGATAVTDAATGKVRYSPAANDFLSSDYMYSIRFRVVRADTKIEFFPNGVPEYWIVRK